MRVHALERDKAYLIQINTGYMPRPKADAFIKQQREILGNKFERTDYGDNEESVIPSKS